MRSPIFQISLPRSLGDMVFHNSVVPLSEAGVLQDVSEEALAAGDFELCWQGRYDGDAPRATVLEGCTGDVLLLGCRAVGEAPLQVAAMGRRSQVFREPANRFSSRPHNGVGWYDSSWGWGFAPEDAAVHLLHPICDLELTEPDLRLCWSTEDGDLIPGGRCGATVGAGEGWERLVFHRPGPL